VDCSEVSVVTVTVLITRTLSVGNMFKSYFIILSPRSILLLGDWLGLGSHRLLALIVVATCAFAAELLVGARDGIPETQEGTKARSNASRMMIVMRRRGVCKWQVLEWRKWERVTEQQQRHKHQRAFHDK
jgi:hypothetical protein